MYSDGIDTWSRDNTTDLTVSSAQTREDGAMDSLKDLIERLSKALRITSPPPQAPDGSASTNHLGPVQGPVQDPR